MTVTATEGAPPAATTPQVAMLAPPASTARDRFNLSSWTLEHQALVIFVLVLLSLFGIVAYGKLA